MADLIFVSIIGAFFALCVLYLRWCDRIIGADDFSAVPDDTVVSQAPSPADSVPIGSVPTDSVPTDSVEVDA
jgi:hypothetical protein